MAKSCYISELFSDISLQLYCTPSDGNFTHAHSVLWLVNPGIRCMGVAMDMGKLSGS